MSSISPLIRDMIREHCEDHRVENVIVNVMREVNANQYFKRPDGNKLFNKRYKELILEQFKEEIGDE